MEVNASKNDTIIDMGFGHGFSLLNFSKKSNKVYGLEVSLQLHEIVTALLDEFDLKANLIVGDFFGIQNINIKFDIIYFHASFHHCNDPVRLMALLKRKLTKNGRVIFANEQIGSGMKYPWNICVQNMDALLAVCKRGWFEVQYNEEFFLELLERSGLCVDRTFNSDSGVKNFIVKQK